MLLTQYTTISSAVDLTSSGADQQLAQGFKLKRAAVAGRVYLYLAKTGSPTGYLQVEFYTDASGPSALMTNGASNPVLCSDITTGWNAFDFDLDARPKLSAGTQYYIVLKATSYDGDGATAYIEWHGDQTAPHYIDGAGYTYNGSAWAALATATDFAFKIYSGRREYVYSSAYALEGMNPSFTKSDDSYRFNHSSLPSIQAVLDFEENVARMIDAWIIGAGLDAPLTESEQIDLVSQYANQCVALDIELTHRTAGFYTQEGGTRAAALRQMCNTLRDDLANNGPISEALRAEQVGTEPGASSALTAGHIESADVDDRDEDTDLVQPRFKMGMWDNS
jgi:hypothetical protein